MLVTTPLKYAAWYYLPGYATRQILSFYHVAYARYFRRPPPAPGTPEYAFHYRMTYLLFSCLYMLYNLYDAASTMEPNYYELLELAPNADESMLKTAFRQFARRYHPDRAGVQSEGMFMEVRDAYDSLRSPVKRFAYERFGPEALRWTQCTTIRDYVRHGLLQALGFYIVSLCSLIFIAFISPDSPVAFWRYILLAFTAVYELLFLLNPSPTSAPDTPFSSVLFSDPGSAANTNFFTYLWPQRVAYQHVRFLHNLWLLGCFALSNVVPVVFPTPSAESKENWILNEAQKIAQVSVALAGETNAVLSMLFHSMHGPRTGTPASEDTFPYLGDLPTPPGSGPDGKRAPAPEVVGLLATELEHLILEAQMRSDGGPLASAMETAVERRRREEAHGRVGRASSMKGAEVGAGGVQGRGWVQTNGGWVQSSGGVGSPARKERVLGYVRGRSRSLG